MSIVYYVKMADNGVHYLGVFDTVEHAAHDADVWFQRRDYGAIALVDSQENGRVMALREDDGGWRFYDYEQTQTK